MLPERNFDQKAVIGADQQGVRRLDELEGLNAIKLALEHDFLRPELDDNQPAGPGTCCRKVAV